MVMRLDFRERMSSYDLRNIYVVPLLLLSPILF